MPEMTLSEAAKWAGVTRPTIHKALTSGRLSGHKDHNGQWQINPAELERVYQPKAPGDVTSHNGAASASSSDIISDRADIGALLASKQAQIDLLTDALADARAMMAEARASVVDARAERDRATAERDKASAAAADAMAAIKQLTDQRANRTPGPPQAAVAEAPAAPDVIVTPPPRPDPPPAKREPLAEALEIIQAMPDEEEDGDEAKPAPIRASAAAAPVRPAVIHQPPPTPLKRLGWRSWFGRG